MSREDKFNEQLEQQVKQGEASMALQAEAQGGQVQASEPIKINIVKALSSATPDELDAIETKLIAAERAPHKNGEVKELELALSRVTNRIKF